MRRTESGVAMHVDSRSWIEWEIIFAGSYESELARAMGERLVPGAVAIDIGANVGVHTLELARRVGPRGLVLAIEPNPPVRERLEANVVLNAFGNVKVFPVAAGEVPARLKLKVPSREHSSHSNQGLSSFVTVTGPADEVPVDVVTVDSMVMEMGLSRVDVVKIDVQGYERAALAGMKVVLTSFRPTVFFEYEQVCWDAAGTTLEDVVALFARNGYEVRLADGSELRAKRIGSHADLVAVPSPGE